jgi:hypothetical protein
MDAHFVAGQRSTVMANLVLNAVMARVLRYRGSEVVTVKVDEHGAVIHIRTIRHLHGEAVADAEAWLRKPTETVVKAATEGLLDLLYPASLAAVDWDHMAMPEGAWARSAPVATPVLAWPRVSSAVAWAMAAMILLGLVRCAERSHGWELFACGFCALGVAFMAALAHLWIAARVLSRPVTTGWRQDGDYRA